MTTPPASTRRPATADGPRSPSRATGPGRARTLLLLATVLGLVLVSCGGGAADVADDVADDAVAEPEDQSLPPDDSAGGEPQTSAMCAEDEPDCQDTLPAPSEIEASELVDPEDRGAAGGAAGSCLAGDPDCTDESFGGQDVTRPVTVQPETSGAEPAERGATAGASGAPISAAYAIDDTTLELTFAAGSCDLVEDVVVIESPDEVRVMVLSGQDPSVDACIAQVVDRTVTVDLDSPLAERAVLDLAG